ncbi:hypothetical protein [Streptomyces erythrochromogenes]|uniref:hypothetical protein n=1 Tax=Streptomyces erythrochromogenes TaxID=285574 RepID=UPI00369BBC6B
MIEVESVDVRRLGLAHGTPLTLESEQAVQGDERDVELVCPGQHPATGAASASRNSIALVVPDEPVDGEFLLAHRAPVDAPGEQLW